MADDGFYMGELNGRRGLVPSNFLTDVPPGYVVVEPASPSNRYSTTSMSANSSKNVNIANRVNQRCKCQHIQYIYPSIEVEIAYTEQHALQWIALTCGSSAGVRRLGT